MLLDGRQDLGADSGQHCGVRPVGLGDQVVQRLMSGLDPTRLDPGGDGLDALAVARQQQAGAVVAKRDDAVSMAESRAKRLDIGSEARFTIAR